MGTDNGLMSPERIRKYIQRLVEYREFLQRKLEATAAFKEEMNPNYYAESSYEGAMIRTLDWVIPLAEAEWHNQIRLNKSYTEYYRESPKNPKELTQ